MQTIKLISISILLMLLVGCSSLLVKEDKPIILNNATGLSDSETLLQGSVSLKNEVVIKSINSNLIDGMVYDISDGGDRLLLSGPSTSLVDNVESVTNYSNLYTYNIKNKQLKQVISSTKQQMNASFDNRNKGVVYVKYDTAKDGKPIRDSYKLNWTDYEGKTTKNISNSDESISPEFSMIDKDYIIYGNSKGQIKLVNIKDISKETITQEIFKLEEKLDIHKIDYYQDYNLAFFLASNPKTKALDLYYCLLSNSEIELEPILLQRNVTDFDMSLKNKKILYNVSKEKTNQLVSVDMLYYNKKVIYEGSVSMFYYTPDEDKIIYGERVDDSSNNQNLWIMTADGNSKIQLASNLKISGDNIIFSPDEDSIFFSVYQLDNKESNELTYKVYMIEFSYSS